MKEVLAVPSVKWCFEFVPFSNAEIMLVSIDTTVSHLSDLQTNVLYNKVLLPLYIEYGVLRDPL